MKKKRWIAVAATALSLVVAAVALAAQVNTYQVQATTSPTKAGSKAKPVPISLNFNYTVGEQSGQRPSPVKQYKIKFSGVKLDQTGLPTCTADKLNSAQTDTGCPKGSKVGSGVVHNEVGPTLDPTVKGECQLALTIYNGIKKHASLWLVGTCAGTAVHNAIDAQYVTSGTSSTLQFTVPPTLLHPIGGVDNAVTYVQSKISLIKVGKGKHKEGYYSSIGGCKGGKRSVSVTFVSEAGQSVTSPSTAPCKA